jgi:hypothetical protein
VPGERIRSERLGGAAPQPAAAAAETPSGAAVAFSRSGVTATWDRSCATLLDLAEANGVPRRRAAASAAATAVARPCVTGASATIPSRSILRPRAARCCAARGRMATSSSTPDDAAHAAFEVAFDTFAPYREEGASGLEHRAERRRRAAAGVRRAMA